MAGRAQRQRTRHRPATRARPTPHHERHPVCGPHWSSLALPAARFTALGNRLRVFCRLAGRRRLPPAQQPAAPPGTRGRRPRCRAECQQLGSLARCASWTVTFRPSAKGSWLRRPAESAADRTRRGASLRRLRGDARMRLTLLRWPDPAALGESAVQQDEATSDLAQDLQQARRPSMAHPARHQLARGAAHHLLHRPHTV